MFAFSIQSQPCMLFQGKSHWTVGSGIFIFCNHGCNGTYNYGDDGIGFTEMNVDLDSAPENVLNKATDVYNPAFERHLRQIMEMGDYTLRDIGKGEEILCNYLSYVGDPDKWKHEVTSLRDICGGESMGVIAVYELQADNGDAVV
mmetsp:Transcript_17214/g.27953  ORF Transcript_17214/g.27953 Transcript_17214/m.27953 type:complete len:145 (+) Transcript_17214:129-563(+)